MLNSVLISLIGILTVQCFNLNPFNRHVLGDVKVIEPYNSKYNNSVVLMPMTEFVTGEFYSNFVYYLTGRNIKVCIPDPDMEKTNNLQIVQFFSNYIAL